MTANISGFDAHHVCVCLSPWVGVWERNSREQGSQKTFPELFAI